MNATMNFEAWLVHEFLRAELGGFVFAEDEEETFVERIRQDKRGLYRIDRNNWDGRRQWEL